MSAARQTLEEATGRPTPPSRSWKRRWAGCCAQLPVQCPTASAWYSLDRAMPGAGYGPSAELLDESERAAAALLGRFEPGERVAVWAPNLPEWLLLEFGAALAGLTLVTVNPALRQRELLHILTDSRAAGIFLVPEYRGNAMESMLEEIRPRLPALRQVVRFPEWEEFLHSAAADVRLPVVGPDAIAQVQYTSGTTGVPKGVLMHHRGLTNAARLWAQTLGARRGECWLNPNPLFHGSGSAFMTLGPLQLLGTQVLCRFDPGLVLELIETERPTVVATAATMVELMVRHPDFGRRNLFSPRVLASGAMPVAPDLVRRVESGLGVSFQISYGQTEACGLTHTIRGDESPEVKAATVGRPLPQVEVRVADPSSGQTQPLGAVGEVLIRGYQVMTGYLYLPEAATAIDSEGRLHTVTWARWTPEATCGSRAGSRMPGPSSRTSTAAVLASR